MLQPNPTPTPMPISAPVPAPSADLAARGLSLFCSVFGMACAVFHAVTRHFSLTNFNHTIKTLKLASDCAAAMLVLQLTLKRAPQRVTPRQLVRLAKAARILTRLTGQSFDFTPWTSLTPAELDQISPLSPARHSAAPAPTSPSPAAAPPSAAGLLGLLRLPDLSACREIRCLGLAANPGATLASFCQKLLRLLPPDFLPDLNTIPNTEGAPVPVLTPSPASTAPEAAFSTPPADAPATLPPSPPASRTAPASSASLDPAYDRFLLQTFFPSRAARPARPTAHSTSRHPPP